MAKKRKGKVTENPPTGSFLKNAREKMLKRVVDQRPKKKRYLSKIMLRSHRGNWHGRGICDECRAELSVVYRYAESNHGTVLICSRCKPKVMGRSFEKVDALNMAYGHIRKKED